MSLVQNTHLALHSVLVNGQNVFFIFSPPFRFHYSTKVGEIQDKLPDRSPSGGTESEVINLDIKIEVENAEKEIKLLEEASSLIDKLQSILRQIDGSIRDCKTFAEAYNPDKN